MIVKSGSKFLVKTSDGSRTLGEHDTEEDAKKQLEAIEISKKEQAEKPQVKKRGYYIG